MFEGKEIPVDTNQNPNDFAVLREEALQEYLPWIQLGTKNTLKETNLVLKTKKEEEQIHKHTGKVRDVYNADGKTILVTTDRLSAFDRHVCEIPCKGAVLNQISSFWFDKTRDIIPNHKLATPHANVTVATTAKPFPIEFVVRGYLTGSSPTSILTHYNNGVRDYCGVELPDGMSAHQKFESPIVTPTTKSAEHDELISPQEIVKQGLMTQKEWEHCSAKALELFRFASEEASRRGLILADTKIEFGKTSDGKIIVIDELFTPDSSRFWLSNSYEESFKTGKPPKSIDKEHVRLWLKENCTNGDLHKLEKFPEVPDEIKSQVSLKYILLYELITGKHFPLLHVLNMKNAEEEIQFSITDYLRPKVLITMGSDSDLPTMIKAKEILDQFGIPSTTTLTSAHRTPKRLEEYASNAENQGYECIIAGAGGAAHLPGMAACQTILPTIGVPVVPPSASKLGGVDALYSIVQMPKGIPVATVALGNAENAGLLAVRILAIKYPELADRLLQYHEAMEKKVIEAGSVMEQLGPEKYLEQKQASEPMLTLYTGNQARVTGSLEHQQQEQIGSGVNPAYRLHGT